MALPENRVIVEEVQRYLDVDLDWRALIDAPVSFFQLQS